MPDIDFLINDCPTLRLDGGLLLVAVISLSTDVVMVISAQVRDPRLKSVTEVLVEEPETNSVKNKKAEVNTQQEIASNA